MRISLMKPDTGGVLGLEMITFVEPLGLECVAGALLRDGHECQILDLRIDGTELGLKKSADFNPDIIGIQCNFTTERYRAIRLAKLVRKRFPDAFIVLGGHDASRDPAWFHQPAIDAISVGDGEEIMAELVDTLDRNKDPAQSPGLVINRDGQQLRTAPAPARTHLDEVPMPARHLIDEYAGEYYFNFHKPLALMETARGCPYRCNFCSVWKFHEKTFREKSPERVVEELAAIKAPHVFITDDIFWINVHRGREIAERIKAAGIKKYFKIQTRTDIICKHPDLIELWRECGNLSIFLGLEKIDDAGLKSVNKNNKAETNNRAIEILQDLGVGYTPNFIVDPDWDLDDFKKLREWVSRTGAYNSGFSVLTPLPGTDLWNDVQSSVTTDDWELFDIVHAVLPTKLSRERFYQEYADLWRHALRVRYREHGYLRTHVELAFALATGRLTLGALKKGMNLSKRFSTAQTFLRGHDESEQRRAQRVAAI